MCTHSQLYVGFKCSIKEMEECWENRYIKICTSSPFHDGPNSTLNLLPFSVYYYSLNSCSLPIVLNNTININCCAIFVSE